MNRAIFLDRDGTLIVDRGYLADPDGVELLPGVGESLARLRQAGFLLVVATNQSGIGRGRFDQAAVAAQHRRLRELLSAYGVGLAAIEVCPHTPEDGCDCRKPASGLLRRAADDLDIDLAASYMIGDKDSDVLAGAQVGCRTFRIGTFSAEPSDNGDWQVEDLTQATRLILDRPSVLAVIPARYASTRFPGKPLAKIAGRPMIEWVCRRVGRARGIDRVLVATDDRRIADTVRGFGGVAVMTSPEHPTGTDRIAEAARQYPGDLIVNVQGDEPLIPPLYLERLIERMVATAGEMGTVAVPFDRTDQSPDHPSLVKVVVDRQGRALYFSRAAIPFARAGGSGAAPLLHWGIYAYRRALLEAFVAWPQGVLERCEMLEQLRALENGVRIQVLIADCPTVGVDEPGDIAKVEAALRQQEGIEP